MPPQLPTRRLGKHGPQVPALGFGLMGLSAFYGKAEPDEVRFPVLDRAYELGEIFWDSADIYGGLAWEMIQVDGTRGMRIFSCLLRYVFLFR